LSRPRFVDLPAVVDPHVCRALPVGVGLGIASDLAVDVPDSIALLRLRRLALGRRHHVHHLEVLFLVPARGGADQ